MAHSHPLGAVDVPTQNRESKCPLRLLDCLHIADSRSSSARIAQDFFAAYGHASELTQIAALKCLQAGCGPERLLSSIGQGARFLAKPSLDALSRLRGGLRPDSERIVGRLLEAPNAAAGFLELRAGTLKHQRTHPELGALDGRLLSAMGTLFEESALSLVRVTLARPRPFILRLIASEAVHPIEGWDDMRRRVEDEDRRCFALLHSTLPERPLVFTEVALTRGMPREIDTILATGRAPGRFEDQTTAAFYSISSCHSGLKGLALGGELLERAIRAIAEELPQVEEFCTLSPMPGFSSWLRTELQAKSPSVLPAAIAPALCAIIARTSPEPRHACEERALGQAAAFYLVVAKAKDGLALDPVARFHLGNGASLARINVGASQRPRVWGESLGVMVNYAYRENQLLANRASYQIAREISADEPVAELLAGAPKG